MNEIDEKCQKMKNKNKYKILGYNKILFCGLE